jgi:hypothetical protein
MKNAVMVMAVINCDIWDGDKCDDNNAPNDKHDKLNALMVATR